MGDQQEERLLAEFKERDRLSRAAWSALTHPVHSVDNDGYRKLVEADAAARAESNRARAALRAYRQARKIVGENETSPT
jgi:hypothetical protein